MKIIVFAGPNGSGKSSIINNVMNQSGFPDIYICPDIYAEQFSYITDIKERYKKSMELCSKLRQKCLDNEYSFAFETVLSRRDKLEFLKAAKEMGYDIQCVYVTTNSPQINIDRVRQRHETGGHDVPKDKIISRYQKSMSLLYELILISDEIKVYDNSGSHPMIVFSKNSDGHMFLLNKGYRNNWVNTYIYEPLKKLNLREYITDLDAVQTKQYLNSK